MHKGEDMEAMIRRFGISDSELGAQLRQIPALKQFLVLDSCQSEASLTALASNMVFRGGQGAEETAQHMLARSNGIYLLAASTRQQYAFEVPALHHGVLTYALLSGLGENGDPKAADSNGIVTALSLIQYVNQRVPELTAQYDNGQVQYPVSFNTGMDFPLSVR
jgi:uncharacterized caspase-like protein